MSVRKQAAQALADERERQHTERQVIKARQLWEELEKDTAALEKISGSPLVAWFGHDWVVVDRDHKGWLILRTTDDDQEAPVWFAVRQIGAGGRWEVKVLDPDRVPDPRRRLEGSCLVRTPAEVGEAIEHLERKNLPAEPVDEPRRPLMPAGESGVSKSPDGRR